MWIVALGKALEIGGLALADERTFPRMATLPLMALICFPE